MVKREYAQLKGDKSDCFFKLSFDEATIHKSDDCFILFGNIIEYQGVVRSYKPTDPILPGICAVPFYGQQYEIRSKDKDGNYKSDKVEPSIFELGIYKYFLAEEQVFLNSGEAIKGSITHLPNAMCQSLNEASVTPLIEQNINVELTPLTGKLPKFTPYEGANKNKSYGSYKGLSPEEKIDFIVKQMETDVKSVIHKRGQCLADLTDQIILEHRDNSNFIEIYFDLLMACVR